MFITVAIAATEAATTMAEPSPMTGFVVQLIFVFAIFYFILIRPQQKKMNEHENMLKAIKPKDKIITGGGIYGTVTKADDEKLTVEIADKVEIKVARSTIRENLSATPVETKK